MINFFDKIKQCIFKAIAFLRGIATYEECFQLKEGEYKIMKPAFSKKNREAEVASFGDFVILASSSKNFSCIKSSDGKLYVGCGFVENEKRSFVVVGMPITDEEKGMLDELVTHN